MSGKTQFVKYFLNYCTSRQSNWQIKILSSILELQEENLKYINKEETPSKKYPIVYNTYPH